MTPYFLKPKIFIAPISRESLEAFDIGNNVLILVSKTILKNFNLNAVFDALATTRNIFVYSHIRPDAPFEDLDLIITELKSEKIDYIIAIGGGSIIDAAKTLSISFEGICYKDIFYGKATLPTTKIKTLAVPTTAGTGAELSFGAIIYDQENSKKGGVRGEIVQPTAVLIDANLHNACPFKLKAEVGFDCLTHAVETYISRKSHELVRVQSVNCIQTIFQYLVSACKENDFHAMQQIAISSALMGLNLAYSSTCLPHRLQYVIGPMTHTSHAQGLIALYKGWLTNLVASETQELKDLVFDLGVTRDEFINKVNGLKRDLNIEYSLTTLGINPQQIEVIANKVTGNVAADPSYTGHNTISNILKYAL